MDVFGLRSTLCVTTSGDEILHSEIAQRPLSLATFERYVRHPDERVRCWALDRAGLMGPVGDNRPDWQEAVRSAWREIAQEAWEERVAWTPVLDAMHTAFASVSPAQATAQLDTLIPYLRTVQSDVLAAQVREMGHVSTALFHQICYHGPLDAELLFTLLRAQSSIEPPIALSDGWIKASPEEQSRLIDEVVARLVSGKAEPHALKRLEAPLQRAVTALDRLSETSCTRILDHADARPHTWSNLTELVLTAAQVPDTAVQRAWETFDRLPKAEREMCDHVLNLFAEHPKTSEDVLIRLAQFESLDVDAALAATPRAVRIPFVRRQIIECSLDSQTVLTMIENTPDEALVETLLSTLECRPIVFLDYVENHPELRLVLSQVQITRLLRSPLAETRRRAIIFLPRLAQPTPAAEPGPRRPSR